MLYRTQGIVIPDTSKLVTRPHFRPLSIIIYWDASVRSQTGLITSSNNKAIESRMQMIPILEWCRSNVVLTKKQFRGCRHLWGNCSESVPWHALTGRRRSRRHRVVLYSRTISLRKMVTVFPCAKCQQVADKMNHMDIARILSW